MVNLNADRNLPPDSTPWGKALERRLSALERENNLLKSDIRNTGKNLNNLTNQVNDRLPYKHNTVSRYKLGDPLTIDGYYIGSFVEGVSRTGRLLVSMSCGVAIPTTWNLPTAVIFPYVYTDSTPPSIIDEEEIWEIATRDRVATYDYATTPSSGGSYMTQLSGVTVVTAPPGEFKVATYFKAFGGPGQTYPGQVDATNAQITVVSL